MNSNHGAYSKDFSVAECIDVLARTPAVLDGLLLGLPPTWILCEEGPDTFSPFDVVGHLIDGEETDWIPRAKLILDKGKSTPFAPYNRFRHIERNKGKPSKALLDEFRMLRVQNMAVLKSWELSEEQLKLEGIHPEFGIVTLRQLLATWMVHDLGHVKQIVRVMARQYSNEVGPWKKYLSILDTN